MHLASAMTYPLNKQCASALLACGQTLPSRHVDTAMRALSVGLMKVVEQFVDPAQRMTEQQQKRLDDFLLLAPISPEAVQISLVRKLDKFTDQLPLLDFAKGRDKLLAYFKTCSPKLNQRIYAGHLASNP